MWAMRPASSVLALLLVLALVPLYAVMVLDADLSGQPWRNRSEFHVLGILRSARLLCPLPARTDPCERHLALRCRRDGAVLAGGLALCRCDAQHRLAFQQESAFERSIDRKVLAVLLTSASLVMGIGHLAQPRAPAWTRRCGCRYSA
jgi:hypothetical protein